jgi:hypothetical protein
MDNYSFFAGVVSGMIALAVGFLTYSCSVHP